MRYTVEIYLPGNLGLDAACSFEVSEPLFPFAKGDIINPRVWSSHYHNNLRSQVPNYPHGVVLRVTGVEHFLTMDQNGVVGHHQIGVFTEALDDVAASRP
jgi:hypothetical protein